MNKAIDKKSVYSREQIILFVSVILMALSLWVNYILIYPLVIFLLTAFLAFPIINGRAKSREYVRLTLVIALAGTAWLLYTMWAIINIGN
ncbi:MULTISPECIES: hypothetical protein [Streptomyces]|uniref:hypothetical protein n=1 Tax=Streptomyces TaxID=1883 RepID=UPI00131A7387|nr:MULTISPECIES: hypothetical protein [Streptomyces]MDX3840069.1 hypothetical protein [Streptomyces europaeiscabiei]